jgi:hypothetical protein
LILEKTIKRIELKVHKMPYSLRKFVEQTMKDDLAFKSALESPLKAMAAAGVNVDSRVITRADYMRIVGVLASLRGYVKKTDKEKIKFEDIFNIVEADPSWNGKERETNTCENKKWDASEPSKSTDKGENNCAWDTFEKGVTEEGVSFGEDRWQEVIIGGPLINSSQLAEIMVQMDKSLNVAKRIQR